MRPAWSILLISLLFLACSATPSSASEENDLWLLISSYEDVGITVQDLAFFLATKGYDAVPEDDYVTVTFSDGTKVYLTPNGAATRLADFWQNPPQSTGGPIQLIPTDAIRTNVTYNKTKDSEFLRTISQYVLFPVTPLGLCYDGSQQLDETYRSFDYNVAFMYDPAQFDSQGHLWVVVEDPNAKDTWIAVDSYYGIMDGEEYYTAPYSFTDFKYLDSINPKWRV